MAVEEATAEKGVKESVKESVKEEEQRPAQSAGGDEGSGARKESGEGSVKKVSAVDDDEVKVTGTGGRDVEIGKEWDDGAENKEHADRDQEDDVQVVDSGNVGISSTAVENESGSRPDVSESRTSEGDSHKRRRADEEVPSREQPHRDHPPSNVPQHHAYPQYRKRARQECYRCGGDGHIAIMCISEPNAKSNMNLTICRNCGGRGHMSRECPNSIPPGVCFRCRQDGHRGRECPNMDVRLAQYGGGGGGQQPQPGYYQQGVYDVGYGYDRGMYGPPMNHQRVAVGTGRCFRCNEPGHWTKDCPFKPQGSDPNGCYKCGQPGHRAKECNVCFKCSGYGHNAFECPQQQPTHG